MGRAASGSPASSRSATLPTAGCRPRSKLFSLPSDICLAQLSTEGGSVAALLFSTTTTRAHTGHGAAHYTSVIVCPRATDGVSGQNREPEDALFGRVGFGLHNR